MSNLYLSYKELVQLPTFDERFEYLKLGAIIGEETFGFNRYLNQNFYRSKAWKRIRHQVIIRDNGCDLACPDRQLQGRIIIHHINPITAEDMANSESSIFDLDNLICVSHTTHNALHYGDISLCVQSIPTERTAGDTKLW